MFITQGQEINYTEEKWNLQAAYISCNIRNKKLFTAEINGKRIIDISCGDNRIEADIIFDAKEQPVKLISFPIDSCSFENVSVLICNTGNRTALYVNGILNDEDWQLGKVPLENCTCSLALGTWSMHSDFSFSQNYRENCGKITNIKNIQNWRPDGHNTGAGDCMPFSHDGIFHLFYLFDRRGHRSKWGLGAHQWAHISTKDFIEWEQHPMALSIDEQYEGSICTGSVVFHNGLYYAFYAVRMSDGSPARLSWAVSRDCIKFEKSNRYCELSSKYHAPSARDPMVIIDKDGVAHMFVTTSIYPENKEDISKGCLAHLISSDMQDWKEAEPLVVLDIENQPECSDYFYFNGWYYLIYSNFGTARYFMSKNPFGPWETPENNIVIDSECRVPKTAKFGKDRIMAAGFIVTPPERSYAGEVIFNEMIQQPDGTFKFIVPKELQ
jgi:hypothetical protein